MNGRKSNFELLRFVAMMFIVLFHLTLNSEYRTVNSFSYFNFIFSFFDCGGKLGVALFVMICGYFMINKEIKFSKLIKLEGQVLFYSILFFIINILFLDGSVNFIKCLNSFLPNIMKSYWFFSSYFVLYLFIPYINKFISIISRKNFLRLLVLGFIFLIFIPSINIISGDFSNILYLVFYYLVGGYISKFYGEHSFNKLKMIILFLASYSAIVLSFMILSVLSVKVVYLKPYISSYYSLDSVFLLISSISLFLFFKDIKIKSKFVNFLGSSSFGIYLFHENIFVKYRIWNEMFKTYKFYGSNLFLFYSIGAAICVYFIGCIIEIVRKNTIGKLFDKLIDYFSKSRVYVGLQNGLNLKD